MSCSKEAILVSSSLHSLKLIFSFDFQCLKTTLFPVKRASFTQEHSCWDRPVLLGKIPSIHRAGLSLNSTFSTLLILWMTAPPEAVYHITFIQHMYQRAPFLITSPTLIILPNPQPRSPVVPIQYSEWYKSSLHVSGYSVFGAISK